MYLISHATFLILGQDIIAAYTVDSRVGEFLRHNFTQITVKFIYI